jgi:hypothetical protein
VKLFFGSEANRRCAKHLEMLSPVYSIRVCLDVKCLRLRFLSITLFSAIDLSSNCAFPWTKEKSDWFFLFPQSLFLHSVFSR